MITRRLEAPNLAPKGTYFAIRGLPQHLISPRKPYKGIDPQNLGILCKRGLEGFLDSLEGLFRQFRPSICFLVV